MTTNVPFSGSSPFTPRFASSPFLKAGPFDGNLVSGAQSDVALLSGALYVPDTSNCFTDFDNTSGAYDKKIALIESEPARAHNYIPNSTFVGGTASTAATGWSLVSAAGVTASVVGIGTDAEGHTYQDVRFVGTGTGNGACAYRPTDGVAYALATQLSASVKVSLIAGSFANVTTALCQVSARTVADAYVANLFDVVNFVTSVNATHTKFSSAGSTTSATVALARFQIACTYANGAVIDFTVRISQPQLERNRSRAFCPTYGTAIAPQATYFCGWQGTDVSKPYLRSADYSIVPFVSGQNTLGPELVVNGTFTTDLTGWLQRSVSSASVSSGVATTTTTGGAGGLMQELTLVVGRSYLLTGRVRAVNGNNTRLSIINNAESAFVLTGTDTTSATFVTTTIPFVATETNSKVYLRCANVGGVAEFDDISVKELLSGTGETWTPNYTVIDDQGGFERSGSDAYWRNSAGTGGNYVSTPDSVAASITGDLTLIVKAELADWTPAVVPGLAAKGSGTVREYYLQVGTTGTLNLLWYTAGVLVSNVSTAAISATDGTACWIKCIKTAGVKVQYYKSTDYNPDSKTGTWTQIGTDVASVGANPTESSDQVLVGTIFAGGNPVAGKIHYAAAWANTTGEGTPAWEFYPARDATFPASPWLQFDGSNDYLVTNIIPGNYSAGFICAGAVQTEAIGSNNNIFGSADGGGSVRGIRHQINSVGQFRPARFTSAGAVAFSAAGTVVKDMPFITSQSYSVTDATARLNNETKVVNTTAADYTGSTQYALIGVSNNTESGVTPANYFQGHIHALAWLPSIPTEAQEASIKNYIANKTGVTL